MDDFELMILLFGLLTIFTEPNSLLALFKCRVSMP